MYCSSCSTSRCELHTYTMRRHMQTHPDNIILCSWKLKNQNLTHCLAYTRQPWTASVNRGSPTVVYITVRHAYPPADEEPWLAMIGHPSSTSAHMHTKSTVSGENILHRVCSATDMTVQHASYKLKLLFSSKSVVDDYCCCARSSKWQRIFLNWPIFMYGVETTDQLCLLRDAF